MIDLNKLESKFKKFFEEETEQSFNEFVNKKIMKENIIGYKVTEDFNCGKQYYEGEKILIPEFADDGQWEGTDFFDRNPEYFKPIYKKVKKFTKVPSQKDIDIDNLYNSVKNLNDIRNRMLIEANIMKNALFSIAEDYQLFKETKNQSAVTLAARAKKALKEIKDITANPQIKKQ